MLELGVLHRAENTSLSYEKGRQESLSQLYLHQDQGCIKFSPPNELNASEIDHAAVESY